MTYLLALTLLLLLFFATAQALWRWASNLTFARRAVAEHSPVENPSCVITFVHGTFARNAPWTLADSALSARLGNAAGGTVQLRRFCWSGWNSFRARSKAADLLADDVRTVHREYHGVPHYLIGHSHGGNVALRAALDADRDAIAGIVCLATPVLTTRRRRFTRSRQIMIGFGFFWLFMLPWLDFSPGASDEFSLRKATALVLSAVAATIWMTFASSLARELTVGPGFGELDPRRVSFIRSPFDEASGVIGTANFVSWLTGRITFGPFELLERFERGRAPGSRLSSVVKTVAVLASAIGVALATTSVVVGEGYDPQLKSIASLAFAISLVAAAGAVATLLMILLAPILRAARSRFAVMLLTWPLFLFAQMFGGLLLAPAILLTAIAHAAAVGVEMLACSILVEVTAEACPAGRWVVRQLRAPPESALRHSSVYASDEGQDEIVAALSAMPGSVFHLREKGRFRSS